MLRSQYFLQQILSGKLLLVVINRQKSNFTCGFKLKIKTSNNITSRIRDGIGAGRVRRTGFLPLPRKILSCPIPVPSLHDGENFLTPSSSPGAPLHPIKFYFLLICPTTSTIFLMKPILLINIYLKLQLNVSHQIKSIFRKN